MPGSSNPPRVSHDASIYTMYGAEAAEIKAAGGPVRRVVLDFKLKKKIYGERNKNGDYGNHSYAYKQEDQVKLPELPIADGKTSMPDLRIEKERADGERAYIDFELAAENYRPAHMSRKPRTGFKIYGVNSTSRRRRAGWEGRELTAQVLAL